MFLLTTAWAQATLYTETLSGLSQTITDGSAFVGSSSQVVSDTGGGTVAGVTVGLNISGGYNGDLYVYLVAPDGVTTVTLLNRPGSAPFYAAGAGFGNGSVNSFVLDSGNGNPSIQTAVETSGVAMTGNFSASGSLANMNGSASDGTWTLYFADLSAGGGTGPSVLNGWTLNLTVVPEPVTLALVVFLVMLLALAGLKWAWKT